MDMTVNIKVLSEMKFWLAWVIEETKLNELFNKGNL